MKTWEVLYAPTLERREQTTVVAQTYTKAIVEFMRIFPKGYIVVELKEVIENESANT